MASLGKYTRFEQLLKFDCKTSTQINSAFVEGLAYYKILANLHTPKRPKKIEETIGSTDVINGTQTRWYYVCPNCEKVIEDEDTYYKICLECHQELDLEGLRWVYFE